MNRSLLVSAAVAVFCVGCETKVEPELVLTATPRTLDGSSQMATIRVTAANDKAQAGTGKVRVSSTAGSLTAAVELDLAAGEASTPFTCATAVDSRCTGSVRISAEWVVSGKLTTATTSITVNAPAVDAGFDAGVVDAGFDAGLPGDAGSDVFTFTSDKAQIIAGVGDVAILSATLTSGGMPQTGVAVDFTTDAGRLGPVGGASVGTMYSSMTDSAGLAQAQLVAGSMESGVATIAAVATGRTQRLSVTIVNVSQITFVSTECPQTTMGCNLMGLQGSGFNETALVKFRVSDGLGAGVSGVQVDFSLINAPAGTTVDPVGTTNAMGEVRANVRSGTTVGTFSVRATAINAMFSVTSPTIGVRGAKASNRGFQLRCDKVNLATNVAVVPPLPISINCQVVLVDRYNNPVGTGTQVRLNSEAGTVPNNVATQAFMPMGTNEGIGNFTFSTLGTYPPQDVPAFAAVAGQYPLPLAAEPTNIVGPLTKNPRDGLLTIIAYLQGEEDFADDNSNGVRDSNEQFIDQGEPFIDRNDNNMRDVGETFIDTPPPDGGMPNGTWDGPNGAWDSNAQIWTEMRLLYSGPVNSTTATLTRGPTRVPVQSCGTVAVGGFVTMNMFLCDENLNRVEQGSQVTARFNPATRGQTTIPTNNLTTDGYGFDFERRLVNAAGTGPCSSTELVCQWRVLFGQWGEGFSGTVNAIAGTGMAMPTPQQLIVDVSTRGTTGSTSTNCLVE